MTRRSLAEVLYEKAEDAPEAEGQEWLLLYDFKGIKPGTKFYTNLARLSALKGKTALIQYSALLTSSRRVALAAKNLAAHYGAKTTVFKVVGTDL
jgi:hypothetical protein